MRECWGVFLRHRTDPLLQDSKCSGGLVCEVEQGQILAINKAASGHSLKIDDLVPVI
jgi:hypothetical protein